LTPFGTLAIAAAFRELPLLAPIRQIFGAPASPSRESNRKLPPKKSTAARSGAVAIHIPFTCHSQFLVYKAPTLNL
jgi:hypothetical protein